MKTLTLSQENVQTVKHALNLFESKLKSKGMSDPNEWLSPGSLIKHLLDHTLSAEDRKKYRFELFEIKIINDSLRYYVNQLARDIDDAFELNAPISQVFNLIDMQQGGYNLLGGKFKFYTTNFSDE